MTDNIYITTSIKPEKLTMGGLGHAMNDVLSAYFIAQLYPKHVRYAHSPILALGDDYHRDTRPDKKYSDGEAVSWDEFLRFGDGEVQVDQTPEDTQFNLAPFGTLSPTDLNFFVHTAQRGKLYTLTQNHRVYLNEIYEYSRDRYDAIYEQLFHKLKHLKRPRTTDRVRVCMHIRRGDCDRQPIQYSRNIASILASVIPAREYELHVYAIGSEDQLHCIRKLVKADQYHFNTDAKDCVLDMYNADILVGGHSCFPKMIATFSRNLFIYLPYNDGGGRALRDAVYRGKRRWGNSIEQIDPTRWIMTDVECQLNRTSIISEIQNVYNTNLKK